MNNRRNFLPAGFVIMLVPGFIIFFRTLALAAGEGIQAASAADGGTSRTLIAYAAMGAVGLSCITSAYALSKIGTAAMGAMSEKPEIGGRALIFLGMAEGIAIYGLIIAIMLINKM